MNELVSLVTSRCSNKQRYMLLPDRVIKVPNQGDIIYVSSFPPSDDLYSWWFRIAKPLQMRVEPTLCEAATIHKNPIFSKSTCQLSHIMSPYSPRCQVSYLKWICNQSLLSIHQTTPNYFVIPEADHSTSFVPPTPYLLTVRNALVSVCGQIVYKCGLIHTTASKRYHFCLYIINAKIARLLDISLKLYNFGQIYYLLINNLIIHNRKNCNTKLLEKVNLIPF